MITSIINLDYREEMCRFMLTTPENGCIVEVGVFQGGSLFDLYNHRGLRQVYGYDTFNGIPYKDEGDMHVIGDFKCTNLEEIRAAMPAAHIVEGIFPDSAVPDMPLVSFVHLDVDQYKSYVDSIKYLSAMMLPGGIMWFDDVGCLDSANRAVSELISDDRLFKAGCGKFFTRF